MECPGCRYENPDDSRFCGECGSSLTRAVTCSSCGHANPGGRKFCNSCGNRLVGESAAPAARDPRSYTPKHLAEKILTFRGSLEGERKQVTVLFADVKGSMELTERMDPEAWSTIMTRLFQILSHGVERFEGFVDKFTGDGIMALFGAPIAHEDHAQRACYAALHLRDEIRRYADALRLSQGIDFSVRMGINSGDVVVGSIGDDLRMDYTAQGHTVGLAQRMEQLAAAHAVCLSEATAKLVSGYVELRDLGPAAVKGAGGPVHVFELVGMGKHRTRLDLARTRGLTRFVGRETDLRMLEAALEQARMGDGQVVGVVAEAGIGKSRLCLEFVEGCRARGISVNQGHCPAHGKTVAYLPVLEMLRDIFTIDDRDSAHEARRKIAGELLLLDEGFREQLPLVFDFLGVPDPERPAPSLSPEARQRQLFAFVRHLTQTRSQRELRVLLLDDAHWIDAGSDAFLAQAVEAANGTRTLLLVNFRPEYHADWMSKPSYRQLPLRPLGREATAELLADLLGRDGSLAGLSETIHARTRGNPFFIEEVVRSLVEKGCLEGARGAYRLVAPVEALEVPGTVQAVLAARLDRLPEREKQLLQTASVIGKEVPGPVLERVAGLPEAERAAALAALVQGEFLFETALYPEAEYAFKHPLTHEVAYASQLAARRVRTHAAVAGALEEVDAERLDERAALLAHHWEEAGDPLVAARWNARAAARASDIDPFEALRHWRKARSLLAEATETDERAELELEVCRRTLALSAFLGVSEEEIAATFARGQALADARGDLRSLGQLHLHYGMWRGFKRHDIAAFARHAQEAAGLAERVGDEGAALAAAAGLALVGWFEGRVLEAIAVGKRALQRAPDDPLLGSEYWSTRPVVWLSGFTRFLEGWAGRPAESLAGLEQQLRLARSQDLALLAQGILHFWATHHAELLGDAAGAMAHARQCVEVFENFAGDRLPLAHYSLGIAHLLEDNSREAASCLERTVAIQEETGGAPVEAANSLSRLAVAYADLGQSERARETAARGLALVRERRLPVFVALALVMQAQVLRKTQGVEAREAIDSALSEAEALVQRTGIRSWQPFIHVERAELARLLGDRTTLAQEFQEAHRLFTEMDATGHAERVAKEIGGSGLRG